MSTRRERIQRLAPFVLASAAALPLAYLPPDRPRVTWLLTSGILMLVVAAAIALLDWDELPLALRIIPALMYLLAVAFLRHADGGSGSGYSPFVLVPLFWIALYGTRAYLNVVIVCIAAVFAVPAVAIGPPLYDLTEFERAAIWIVVGAVVGVTVQRMTGRIRTANEQLYVAAWTDSLTGVGNRRAWDAALRRELSVADRSGTTLALGLIDLDRFKKFNDEHGHQAGDRLLHCAAQRWSGQLRPRDLLVRWGGEEFAGLTFRRPGEPAAEAIRRADTLLYAAKQAGRDRLSSRTQPRPGAASMPTSNPRSQRSARTAGSSAAAACVTTGSRDAGD